MPVATGHGSLPTPPVLDIGDRSFNSSKVATHAARHRLPIFLTLREDADKPVPVFGQKNTISPENDSSQTLERIPMSSVLNNPCQRTQPTHGTRSSAIEAMCGGVCDGVTCMLSTSRVSDAPCLRFKQHSDGLCGGTPTMPNLPNSDELCPFHHIPSMWLVSVNLFRHVALVFILNIMLVYLSF